MKKLIIIAFIGFLLISIALIFYMIKVNSLEKELTKYQELKEPKETVLIFSVKYKNGDWGMINFKELAEKISEIEELISYTELEYCNDGTTEVGQLPPLDFRLSN
jgi:hypothetical protein